MKNENKLTSVLRGRGIHDAYEFLDKNGKNAKVGRSSDPDVRMRGNVQLMKNRKISRAQVAEGFARLKFF
jgi:hypothetical protein